MMDDGRKNAKTFMTVLVDMNKAIADLTKCTKLTTSSIKTLKDKLGAHEREVASMRARIRRLEKGGRDD